MNDFRSYKGYCEECYSLSHHGIKGMRWGIRRYQNPDGSLTAEGKRRYNLSDEKAYGEYKSKEKQIREKADAGAMVGALASLMGSGAAILPAAAVISGPAILAVPAIGMAGMYASVIISEKIGDKKVDDLKKSYNKERIEKAEKIVKNFSDMRVDAISKELKNRGMNLDTSGKKAISNALTYKIAEQLNDGIVTFNDIKKSDPKVGLTTNEQRAAERAVRSASNLQNQMRLAQEQAIRSQQEFQRQVEMNNQIEMQNQLAYNQMQMMIPH